MNDTTQALVADQVLLTVDYGQSLQQMIAAGRYDWINPDITATRFPMQGTDTAPISAGAVAAITAADAEKPWAPALIEHLLAFGAVNPDEQRRYLIVALGSVAKVSGFRHVPCLDGDDAERSLSLDWWDSVWDDHYRFLAVRNLPSGA